MSVKPTTTIKLTGQIANLETFQNSFDIEEDIADLIDQNLIKDGDIVIVPNLDAMGRLAVRWRHTNLGYSGYLAGFLYFSGKKHRIKNWISLFPKSQNRYARQYEKDQAAIAVSKIVQQLRGSNIDRVHGGWKICVPEPISQEVELVQTP